MKGSFKGAAFEIAKMLASLPPQTEVTLIYDTEPKKRRARKKAKSTSK